MNKDERTKAIENFLIESGKGSLCYFKAHLKILEIDILEIEPSNDYYDEFNLMIKHARLKIHAFEEFSNKVNANEFITDNEVIKLLQERRRATEAADLMIPPTDYDRYYENFLKNGVPEAKARELTILSFESDTDPRAIKPEFME